MKLETKVSLIDIRNCYFTLKAEKIIIMIKLESKGN